jgi:hypothetical protein
MGEVFGLLALLPLVGLADWIKFIKRLPPREQEFARASHGMALLVMPTLIAVGLFGSQDVIGFLREAWADGGTDPWLWVPALILAVTTIFGLFWLIIGGSRCPGPFDARLFTRALAKTGVGAVAWVLGERLPPDWVAVEFLGVALMVIGLWCLITGLTKMLLLLIGGSSAERRIRRHIQSKNEPLRPARPRTF